MKRHDPCTSGICNVPLSAFSWRGGHSLALLSHRITSLELDADTNTEAGDTEVSLLQLPAPCLFEVMRWLAQDSRSLFSAARAHSRLRQTAAAVLTQCIFRSRTSRHIQKKWSSLLLYLSRYGQHVSGLEVQHSSSWNRADLQELPTGLLLRSLRLDNMSVQLYPGSDKRGVLEALTALTKLQLLKCCFLDATGPADAVQQLPRLQHLEAVGMRHRVANTLEQEPHVLFSFGSKVLQQLEGLTHLELEHCELDLPTSEPLLQLSNLRSLRLRDFKSSSSNADRLLAGMQHLTMLELQPLLPQGVQFAILPPDITAGRSQLQHLDLSHYMHTGNAAAITNFLCDLEQLTQLTHLGLHGTLSLPDNYKALPAAAAYAALTASSKLQQLHRPACKMPAGAWQHMLPFGRQLPHLQELQLSDCPKMGVFDVASLVSCCPNMQWMALPPLLGGPAAVLAPLHRLTALQTLTVPGQSLDDAAVKVLTKLTGLQELNMVCDSLNGITCAGMLHLTALRQLRNLRFTYSWMPRAGTAHPGERQSFH